MKSKFLVALCSILIIIAFPSCSSNNREKSEVDETIDISSTEFVYTEGKSKSSEHFYEENDTSIDEKIFENSSDSNSEFSQDDYSDDLWISGKEEEKSNSTSNETENSEKSENNLNDDNNVSVESEMVWIPVNGGKKYHKRANCSNMDSPDKVTLEEAVNQGFEPCKRCYK